MAQAEPAPAAATPAAPAPPAPLPPSADLAAGLTSAQAADRLRLDGPNTDRRRRPPDAPRDPRRPGREPARAHPCRRQPGQPGRGRRGDGRHHPLDRRPERDAGLRPGGPVRDRGGRPAGPPDAACDRRPRRHPAGGPHARCRPRRPRAAGRRRHRAGRRPDRRRGPPVHRRGVAHRGVGTLGKVPARPRARAGRSRRSRWPRLLRNERGKRHGPGRGHGDRRPHQLRGDRAPPRRAGAGERLPARRPGLRRPGLPGHDDPRDRRARDQPCAAPARARLAAVCDRARGRPHAGASAGHRDAQPHPGGTGAQPPRACW